eukprot:3087003-Rhodomonas_salina.1
MEATSSGSIANLFVERSRSVRRVSCSNDIGTLDITLFRNDSCVSEIIPPKFCGSSSRPFPSMTS